MSIIKRLPPYLVFVLSVSGLVLYAGGYVWSSSILEFNVTSEAYYANWTQSDWVDPYAFNVSVGYLYINTPGVAWILLNATNSSFIRTSASDFADMILVNNTLLSNQVNVSNNSYANFTIRFNASLLKPGRYTGNLSLANATNANAAINNITIRLDIPLTTNQTFAHSNNFFGNLSVLNSFDVFYFNSTSTSGFYANVNSSLIDLLLFDANDNLVGLNNTNSTSGNKTLLYAFPSYNSFYQLKVFYNTSNASKYIPYNGIIEFSYINSSLSFLNFLVNATPDAATGTGITLNLNNTGQVNYSTLIETEQVYKLDLYVNLQNSTNITIPIAGHYVSIDTTIEWNNASADFNLTIYNSSTISVANQSKRTDMFNITGLGFNRIFSRSTAGVNEFNKSWAVSVVGDKLVYYNLTIKINIDNTWLNSSFGNYTRQYVLNATQNGTSINFNVTVPALSTDGIYNGTITFFENGGHYMAVPFGINVTEPMLVVNNTLSGLLLYVTDNVGTNKTLDYTLTINNTGTFSLLLNDYNSTSLNSSGGNFEYFNYSFENPVTARNSTLLKIRINQTTLTSATGESIYLGWIKLNSTSAHPYKDFLVNITFNLTDKLNVLVSNVANQTDRGLWINPINKTENYSTIPSSNPVFINVTVNVTYQNGTFVSVLNATNFTVWLQNEFPYEGSNYTINFTTAGVANVIRANPSLNNYVLNVSVPSNISGGNYSVYATAYDSSNGPRNGGTAKFNYLYVNSSALAIDVYNGTHDNDDFTNIGSRSIFVNVTNVGGGAIFNASLSLSLSGSCSAVTSGYTADYDIGNISGFSSYTNSSATWKIEISSNSTCTATIVGKGPSGVWVLNDTLVFIYTGTVISSGNNPSNTGGSGPGNALALTIVTGDSVYFKGKPVSFNFSVSSGGSAVNSANVKYNITNSAGAKVAEGSCSTGSGKCDGSYNSDPNAIGTFTISATATKDGYTSDNKKKTFEIQGYNATIPTYTKTIYILQGSANSTTATIKNSGIFDGAMSLSIKDIDASWWKINPDNATLSAGQTASFGVNFSVPAGAVVKNYTAKYSVTADTEIQNEYFYLVVTPTEKTKSEINATVLNYTELLNGLMARLNVTTFPAFNSTELKIASDKLNLAYSLLSQANDSIYKGDYVKANEFAIQSKALLDSAETLIRAAEAGQGNKKFENVLVVAGVVAGVIFAGLLVYTMLPEPGYSSSKGYTVPEQAGSAGAVKQKFKKIENIVQEIVDKLKELVKKISGKKEEEFKVVN
ncbi:MAG: hypothetical protein HYT71_00240 [Candidatus Aenigmarchaeota archaeon]|nr:hypothetical protein [Candidatus Aenigmarchaeota archaeon]